MRAVLLPLDGAVNIVSYTSEETWKKSDEVTQNPGWGLKRNPDTHVKAAVWPWCFWNLVCPPLVKETVLRPLRDPESMWFISSDLQFDSLRSNGKRYSNHEFSIEHTRFWASVSQLKIISLFSLWTYVYLWKILEKHWCSGKERLQSGSQKTKIQTSISILVKMKIMTYLTSQVVRNMLRWYLNQGTAMHRER